jgi:[protein-PII] uridylyltransferase
MEHDQLVRLESSIESALANKIELLPQLVAKPSARPRADAFEVRQRVIFDNDASNRYTVIEVNARDRPALLNRLARALFEAGLMVHSAHIATYGERAADTFYVTDALGDKVRSPARLLDIEKALLDAANENLVPAKGKKAVVA